MVTSPSEDLAALVRGLSIPEDATEDEAAAIVAAIGAHLTDRERAAAGEARPAWRGRKWAYAGRLAAVSGRGGRVPDEAPGDPWTAAGRADRF